MLRRHRWCSWSRRRSGPGSSGTDTSTTAPTSSASTSRWAGGSGAAGCTCPSRPALTCRPWFPGPGPRWRPAPGLSLRWPGLPGGRRPASSAAAKSLDQGGDDLVQVADDGVVGVGQDGGARVGVDGNDVLGAGAAGDVLDGAADAAGQVELRGDLGAGLADLLLVRAPALRGDHAGHPDHAAEQPGQFLQRGEAVRAADAAAA